MTGLSTADPVASAPGPERRRRTPWVIAVAVAVVLALAIGTGWMVLVGRAADKVDAEWSLDCAGKTLGTYEGDRAIRSRPDWTCEVVLAVHNEGGRAVRVRRVLSPILGSGGRAEIQALATDDADLSDGADGDIDAVWTVNLEVPAGASRTITLAIGWRQNGCNSAGALSLDDWPTIELEALHRTFEYAPEQRLVLRTFDDRHDLGRCGTR